MAPVLPTIEAPAPLTERADAARNRQRILCEAARLVAERGIEAVSMQDVAQAAGVGAGTLYRRFGDRAGLALALLDDRTRALQDELIAGPPPVGPGAPAADRLQAFGERYLAFLDDVAELLVAAVPPDRVGAGPFPMYATHLTILLREASPHLDAEVTAQILLASLDPMHHLHARRRLGWPLERLSGGWAELVAALCAAR